MSAPSLTVYKNGVNQVSGDQFNTFTQWSPSAATLRGLIGVTNMLVYLEGYSTPGDGGQGPFYWNATGTTADDGGVTTIVPNGVTVGIWSRLGAPGLTLASLTVTGNSNLLGTNNTIAGVITNSNASAGFVGEYISSTIAANAAVSLSTGVSANVTSISLTAGDWNLFGGLNFTGASSTVTTLLQGGISINSASISGQSPQAAIATGFSITGTTLPSVPLGTIRMSLATTTTIYLVAASNFGTSTNSAYGFIGARRVR